jgi:hypothetical protein
MRCHPPNSALKELYWGHVACDWRCQLPHWYFLTQMQMQMLQKKLKTRCLALVLILVLQTVMIAALAPQKLLYLHPHRQQQCQ